MADNVRSEEALVDRRCAPVRHSGCCRRRWIPAHRHDGAPFLSRWPQTGHQGQHARWRHRTPDRPLLLQGGLRPALRSGGKRALRQRLDGYLEGRQRVLVGVEAISPPAPGSYGMFGLGANQVTISSDTYADGKRGAPFRLRKGWVTVWLDMDKGAGRSLWGRIES